MPLYDPGKSFVVSNEASKIAIRCFNHYPLLQAPIILTGSGATAFHFALKPRIVKLNFSFELLDVLLTLGII